MLSNEFLCIFVEEQNYLLILSHSSRLNWHSLSKGVEFLPQTQIFLFPTSMQPDGVHLRYLKLRSFDSKEFIV